MNGPGPDREHFFVVLDDPLLDRFFRVVRLRFKRSVPGAVVQGYRIPPPGRHPRVARGLNRADERATAVLELEIVDHVAFDSDD